MYATDRQTSDVRRASSLNAPAMGALSNDALNAPMPLGTLSVFEFVRDMHALDGPWTDEWRGRSVPFVERGTAVSI